MKQFHNFFLNWSILDVTLFSQILPINLAIDWPTENTYNQLNFCPTLECVDIFLVGGGGGVLTPNFGRFNHLASAALILYQKCRGSVCYTSIECEICGAPERARGARAWKCVCGHSPGAGGGGWYSPQILVGICAAAKWKMGGSGPSSSVKMRGFGASSGSSAE